MALAKPRFTCFTAQKVVVFDDREEVLKEQRSKLESYVRGSDGDKVVLSGGCISASTGLLGHGSGFVAAFAGSLDNFQQLTKQISTENKDTNSSSSAPGACATLVCNLYKVYGRVVPQRLRGEYSFVLYDSAQGRVLAAASHSSRTPLLQARGPDGCLIITTHDAQDLPEGTALITAIPQGHVKYGWSSEPQPFSDPRIAAELKNIKIGRSPKKLMTQTGDETPTAVESSSASFPDGQGMNDDASSQGGQEPQSPAIKKTRRGKRAGKNQKLRAELMARLSSDVGRGSLDLNSRNSFSRQSVDLSQNSFDMGRGSLEYAPVTPSSSFSSRADGQSWWRTDTPRSSFEVRSLPNHNGFISRPSLSSFSRSSMSAHASPFVPGSFTSQQPINIQRSPNNTADMPSTARLQPRTASQEMNYSRVILKTSMSGALSGSFSPFQEPAAGAGAGKADAAWDEGDVPHVQHSPVSSPGAAGSLVGNTLEARANTLEGRARSAAQPIPISQARSRTDSDARNRTAERVEDSAKQERGGVSEALDWTESRPAVAARNDSAHEEVPAKSAHKASTRPTSPTEQSAGGKVSSAFTAKSSQPSIASESEDASDREHVAGASPPRGSSPSRPPKHPGAAKPGFKQMLRSLIQRRPSTPDLESVSEAEGHASAGQTTDQSWARSASHSALVELDSPTGLWDAPSGLKTRPLNTSHRTSSSSLASQKQSDKSKPRSGKSSPHGSHGSNQSLAWLARQTRSIFSKSKSCNDLKEMDSMAPNPQVTAGGT